MKADVVISCHDDDFLIVARRKHRFKATPNVAELAVVAPLALVEHIAEKKYHFRSENRENTISGLKKYCEQSPNETSVLV